MHSVRVVAASLAALVPVLAADWPQYRGPHGDGSSPEIVRTNWAAQIPREIWRKRIGPGFSSMAVSGGRVLTLARRTINGMEREVCLALDAGTGQELWAADVDAAIYSNLSGYDDAMDGPRSTPTVEGERVYISTSQLKLFCLAAADGQVIWHRDFRSEIDSGLIAWENAASPTLVGDLIFLNANAAGRSLTAVRKLDGRTAWSKESDGLTHATPVRATLGGIEQIIFLTRSGLVAVVPETGDILWRLGFSPSATSTAASPAVSGEFVYASAAYGFGTWMARVVRSGDEFSATEAWRQRGNAYQAHWSSPVSHDGFLYCVPSPSSGQGRLTCLDPASGSNRWSQSDVGSGRIGFGSVIKAANALIVLTEAGELVLVAPNPDAYTEIARHKVLDPFCWNNAALSRGRLFARSTSLAPEIVAVDVAIPGSEPAPKVTVAAERAADTQLRLTVRAADGSSLDPAQAARFEVRTTTQSIHLPVGQWSVVPQSFAPTNGLWLIDLLLGPEPFRFLQIREKTAEP